MRRISLISMFVARLATPILRSVARLALVLWGFLRRNAALIGAIGAVVFFVVALVALWKGPELVLAPWEERLEPKDFVQQMNNIRTTLVQVLAGVFALTGILIAWRRLDVAQQGQITERFTRAIDQLGSTHADGSPNLEVRLGGIYALERIARDSERDHWPIMEVLTAYVREHCPLPLEQPAADEPSSTESDQPGPKTDLQPPPKDVQAILTVIGRRRRIFGRGEEEPLDFHDACLSRAGLGGAHLEGANLWGAHLQEAQLWDAHLEGAGLGGAHLGEAELSGAHLEKAHLSRAHLQGTSLVGAHLEGAVLVSAHLEGAFFQDAHLERASFMGAHLQGAILVEAHLGGADLRRARLQGADLRETIGLTKMQIKSAITDEKTRLPDYLEQRAPKETGEEGN